MFIYLLAMSGIVISTHYCGSKLVSWNVYLKAALCGGCGKDDHGKEKKPMKCCKDKVLVAKVQHDQNDNAAFKYNLQQPTFTPAVLPQFPAVIASVPAISPAATLYRPNAPPGNWQNIPLYKLHARLTYYG